MHGVARAVPGYGIGNELRRHAIIHECVIELYLCFGLIVLSASPPMGSWDQKRARNLDLASPDRFGKSIV